MKLKLYSPIVTGLLILSIALNVMQCERSKKEHDQRFEDARKANQVIALQTSVIDSVDQALAKERQYSRFKELKNKASQDSVQSLLTQQRSSNTANRAKIQPKLDQDPELGEFVGGLELEMQELADLNVLQSEGFKIKSKTMDDEITGLKVKLLAKDQIIVAKDNALFGEQQKTKKEKVAKNVFKFLFGVTVVGSAVLLSQ